MATRTVLPALWTILASDLAQALGDSNPSLLIRRYLSGVQRCSDRFAIWDDRHPLVRIRSPTGGSRSPGWLPCWLPVAASKPVPVIREQSACRTADETLPDALDLGPQSRELWLSSLAATTLIPAVWFARGHACVEVMMGEQTRLEIGTIILNWSPWVPWRDVLIVNPGAAAGSRSDRAAAWP